MSFYSACKHLFLESMDLTGAEPTDIFHMDPDFELTEKESNYIDKFSSIVSDTLSDHEEDLIKPICMTGRGIVLSNLPHINTNGLKDSREKILIGKLTKGLFGLTLHTSGPSNDITNKQAFDKFTACTMQGFNITFNPNIGDVYYTINDPWLIHMDVPLKFKPVEINKVKKRLTQCFTGWVSTLKYYNTPVSEGKYRPHFLRNETCEIYFKERERDLSRLLHKDVRKDYETFFDTL